MPGNQTPDSLLYKASYSIISSNVAFYNDALADGCRPEFFRTNSTLSFVCEFSEADELKHVLFNHAADCEELPTLAKDTLIENRLNIGSKFSAVLNQYSDLICSNHVSTYRPAKTLGKFNYLFNKSSLNHDPFYPSSFHIPVSSANNLPGIPAKSILQYKGFNFALHDLTNPGSSKIKSAIESSSGDSIADALNVGGYVIYNSPYSWDPVLTLGDDPKPCHRFFGLISIGEESSLGINSFIDEPVCSMFVSRLVAMPGDSVFVDSLGRLFINGSLKEKPYVKNLCEKRPCKEIEAIVPNDSVFLLGDNRRNSWDSRYFPGGPFCQ